MTGGEDKTQRKRYLSQLCAMVQQVMHSLEIEGFLYFGSRNQQHVGSGEEQRETLPPGNHPLKREPAPDSCVACIVFFVIGKAVVAYAFDARG